MARCTSCGAELPDYYTSCPNCGGTQVVRNNGAPQPQMNPYAQPAVPQRVVTTFGGWIGWLLLCIFLPIVGPIIMLCTAKDPSAKNYAKLTVICMIVGAVIGGILSAILIPALIGYMHKVETARTVYGMILPLIRF